MIDYWLRLYRKYDCTIEQVVIFLKQTNSLNGSQTWTSLGGFRKFICGCPKFGLNPPLLIVARFQFSLNNAFAIIP